MRKGILIGFLVGLMVVFMSSNNVEAIRDLPPETDQHMQDIIKSGFSSSQEELTKEKVFEEIIDRINKRLGEAEITLKESKSIFCFEEGEYRFEIEEYFTTGFLIKFFVLKLYKKTDVFKGPPAFKTCFEERITGPGPLFDKCTSLYNSGIKIAQGKARKANAADEQRSLKEAYDRAFR